MLEALNDFGIEKLDVLNDIYNNGDRLKDLNRCIFITLPKKLGTNEYKFHQSD